MIRPPNGSGVDQNKKYTNYLSRKQPMSSSRRFMFSTLAVRSLNLASILIGRLVEVLNHRLHLFDDISGVLVLQLFGFSICAYRLDERTVDHVQHTPRPLARQGHGQYFPCKVEL